MIDYSILQSSIGQEIEPSRDGAFTLRFGEHYVHSKYAPLREAERLVEKIVELDPEHTLVICLGAGLGYHIERLQHKGFRYLAVVERDPRIYSWFRKVYSLTNIPFIISPDDAEEKIDTVFSSIRMEQFRNIKTIQLRGAYSPDKYARIEERIERLVRVKLGDFTTRLKFEELWFINIIKNLVHLRDSIPVSRLIENRLNNTRSFPLVIISAGPSLKNSLPDLQKAAPYAVLAAVDTALIPLYEAGIVPDFVYSLDSQIHNLSDFSMLPREYLEKITLIYDAVVNPTLPNYFPGSKVMANTAHLDFDYQGNPFLIKNELVNWLEVSAGFRLGDVETGGSVATSAFHLAYLLGADPIVLLGQDLAYTRYTSHSPSTPHFYRIIRYTSRLLPLESVFISVMRSREAFPVTGLKGKVSTDYVLNNFRGWFVESGKNIKALNRQVGLVNATGEGSVIDGFTQHDLAELAREWKNESKPDFSQILQPTKLIDLAKIDKMIIFLQELAKYLQKINISAQMFEEINSSDYHFLSRYFMREQMIWERYGNFEERCVVRKIKRLLKTISGVCNGVGKKGQKR